MKAPAKKSSRMDAKDHKRDMVLEMEQRLFRRHVIDHPKVQGEIDQIRIRHLLPVANWEQFKKRRESAVNDLIDDVNHVISTNRQINTWWRGPLIEYVVTGKLPSGTKLLGPKKIVLNHGFLFYDHAIVLRSETPITHPDIIAAIVSLQRELMTPPPKPVRYSDGRPGLDWKPTWEWHQQHPYVGYKQLAQLLGYKNAAYVQRKLSEFDRLDG